MWISPRFDFRGDIPLLQAVKKIFQKKLDIPPCGRFILLSEGAVRPVKINEVEALVGISKKNIRFYEQQELLCPRRNSENSYRDYGEEEVRTLQRIKLLRKLGVPIEEIRQMLRGSHTVGDGMRRHLVSMERERRNLEQSMALCRELQALDIPAAELDAGAILTRMEEMERLGTSFRNRQEGDIRIQYVAPVAVTVLLVGLMLAAILLMFWAYGAAPQDAPPIWVLVLLAAGCLAVCGGIVFALSQRIREIEKGEMNDAKRY